MSDSATPFGTVSNSQTNQTAKANSLFDAVFSTAVYALRAATTTGLTLGWHGGKIFINGVVTPIAEDQTISLSASATNYLMIHPLTGVVSKNTTGYAPGYWRMGRAVTGSASITTWYDDRALNFGKQTSLLSKAFPSDANYTLTAAEADVDYIKVSSGTITTTRDLIVPVAFPKEWTVINGNAQSVRIIGASGTGITVATGKTAKVFADGTNVVRVTADT